jgi:hypothetical protein
MAGGQEKWYFTKEQLQNSASRKCGLDADKELAYRQQAANLIQDMGQRLQVYPFQNVISVQCFCRVMCLKRVFRVLEVCFHL